MRSNTWRRLLLLAYALFLAAFCIVLLLWPAMELGRALFDRNLVSSEPAGQAWRWHRALSPAYQDWAEQRVRDGSALAIPLQNISGTEWPLFGSVFFLRATENLDRAWTPQNGERPVEYARGAIDAAAALLVDPGHASWVIRHWGEDQYLRRENVFYRMLLIDGIATHARLTGSEIHLPQLRAQVEGLSDELSQSPTGLLADYPGETYPSDVAAAWHAILRADSVLGTDHSHAAQQGLRGFIGAMAPEGGLPPYAWHGEVAPYHSELRGCANIWLLHNAAYVWPQQAARWFAIQTRDFWQEGPWLGGYREFDRSWLDSLYGDVDSGPVIAGYGTSATAFGLGAARTFGAGREARIIALQAIAASFPLPNGRLLGPRLLSDASDAPLLGEASMLYNLSQPTAPGFAADATEPRWRDVPGVVWLVLGIQLLLGVGGLWRASVRLRQAVAASDR